MTVTATSVRTAWGAGVGGPAAPLTTDFRVFAASEVEVYEVVDATGVWTLQTEGAGNDYTISIGTPLPGLATITPVANVAGTAHWVAVAKLPVTQEQAYSSVGVFPSAAHEEGMDRLALLHARVREMITRSLNISLVEAPLDMELPKLEDRQGKLLGFNSGTGLPEAIAPGTLVDGGVALTANGQALIETTTIAAMRAFLSVAENVGDVDKLDAGTETAKPAAGTFGEGIYISTDRFKVWYSDGANWFEMGVGAFTNALFPAFGEAGRISLDTDKLELYHDDGSAWELVRPFQPGHIRGFHTTWLTNTTLRVADGTARDQADAQNIVSAFSGGQLDKALTPVGWVEGAGGGTVPVAVGLGTSWLNLFVIGKLDGTVDYGFDTSDTAANLLAEATGYTLYRRIAYVKMESSVMIQWIQSANCPSEFAWETPIDEDMLSAGDASYGAGGLTVAPTRMPPNCVVQFTARAEFVSVGLFHREDVTSVQAASATYNPLLNIASGASSQMVFNILSDPGASAGGSGRVHYNASTDTSSDLNVAVHSWRDDRGEHSTVAH